MAEDNFDFNSSQESPPMSQETYDSLWNDISLTYDELYTLTAQHITSLDGVGFLHDEIKAQLEAQHTAFLDETRIVRDEIKAQFGLDSSDLNNPTNELELGAGIQAEIIQVLDSSDLNNPTNELELGAGIQAEIIQAFDSSDLNNPSSKLQLDSGIQSEMIHTEYMTVSSTQEIILQSPSLVQYAASSVPASQTWPGEYEFTVSFHGQEKYTKGVAWTYSETKDKLYVGKDAKCPINFSTNTVFFPNDVSIRVMALYTSLEYASEIVHRCVNHSMDELKNGVFEAEHLIRSECSMATYHIDSSTGRHSVIVPFENPPVGQDYSTYIYKFACFGSCAGGPNRRPLMLIFTLERNDQVIGRRKLNVKICACPGRDRKADESQCKKAGGSVPAPRANNHQSQKRKEPELDALSEALNFTHTPSKKNCTPSESKHYTIDVEDEECYEFLLQMRKCYDASKVMKGLSPPVSNLLQKYQKKRSEMSD